MRSMNLLISVRCSAATYWPACRLLLLLLLLCLRTIAELWSPSCHAAPWSVVVLTACRRHLLRSVDVSAPKTRSQTSSPCVGACTHHYLQVSCDIACQVCLLKASEIKCPGVVRSLCIRYTDSRFCIKLWYYYFLTT